MKIKLSEVAQEYKGKTTNKNNSVGLEHLDSDNITLNRYDACGDNTFTKAFKKGQILFGRRRAYLHKAVVAPFDGVCSGDIIVIEAIPNKIDPGFLPFIIQNKNFFDYAVEKSAGSLSPRVKWEQLRAYEFELPDLKEQKRLAKVLWKIEDIIFYHKNLTEKAKDLYQEKTKKIKDLYDSKTIETLVQNCKLQKADIGTVPYLEIGDIDIDTKCYTLKNKPSVAGANFVVKNDILISLVRPTRGAIVKIDDECISASNAFCLLRGRNNLITEYLFNYLMYNLDFFKSFESKQSGSTYPTCKENDVLEYLIPIPETDEILSCLTDELKCATKTIDLLTNKLKTMKNIENQILKEALHV